MFFFSLIFFFRVQYFFLRFEISKVQSDLKKCYFVHSHISTATMFFILPSSAFLFDRSFKFSIVYRIRMSLILVSILVSSLQTFLEIEIHVNATTFMQLFESLWSAFVRENIRFNFIRRWRQTNSLIKTKSNHLMHLEFVKYLVGNSIGYFRVKFINQFVYRLECFESEVLPPVLLGLCMHQDCLRAHCSFFCACETSLGHAHSGCIS